MQQSLRAFDDNHNGALDPDEFERFAKSLMNAGELDIEQPPN
jgi:Ca2+-binding EF-hand superfamily protein